MREMNLFDQITLLLTGLTAVYLIWRFYGRFQEKKAVYDIFYMIGFAVLFVSGVLLIFGGWDILANPLVLTVATLIPFGISMGLVAQFLPKYKKPYMIFAVVGFLAIAVTSTQEMSAKSIVVPLFHGIAGLIIFALPLYLCYKKQVPKGFGAVGVGGLLIGIGGMALAFEIAKKPLFGILDTDGIRTILAPLLLLMTLAYTWGFVKDIKYGDEFTS